MTHKFTIKPLIKAGIFSLIFGRIFAVLAKLGANKKRVPQSPSTTAEETSEEGGPSTIAEETSEEGSPSTCNEETSEAGNPSPTGEESSGKDRLSHADQEKSEENNNTEKNIDHGSTNTTKRSPFSLTPDPMPLRTNWHRKFKLKTRKNAPRHSTQT